MLGKVQVWSGGLVQLNRRPMASFYASTALALLLTAASTQQPAWAQTVNATLDVIPLPSSNPLPSWIIPDSNLVVGDTSLGQLEIKDGGKVESQAGTIGHFFGSTGTVAVRGNDSEWKNGGKLTVGDQGTGSLSISDGGTVTSHQGFMGHINGSEGIAVLSSGSAWNNLGDLFVGYGGDGRLAITNGARVTNTNGYIGSYQHSDSSVSVSGVHSLWNSSGFITVGDNGKGVLNIANGGRVEAGNGSGTVYLGHGTLGSGTLTIGSITNNLSTAGTLAAKKVEFGNGTATLNFNYIDRGTVFAASLTSTGTGTHTVNHSRGSTTMTGDSSGFTGTTTVTGGTLLVGDANKNGALGGEINVLSGGVLSGTGNLGSLTSAVTIASGGTHVISSASASQKVLGDYINHGKLRITATPAGAGKIVVNGDVDIANATLDLVLSPNSAASWNIFNGPFTIIDKQSAGAVTGTFTQPYTQNLLFLNTMVAYDGGDGNDITLSLERNDISFPSVAETRNQIATGTAIESLGNRNALWASLALTNEPATARASFDALSGELHASAKTSLIEDSRLIRNAMNDRIRNAFATTGAPAQPVFWSQGLGSWGSSNSDDNAAYLDRSTSGVLIGTDRLIGDWRAGLLAGYSHSSFKAKHRLSSGKSDSYH